MWVTHGELVEFFARDYLDWPSWKTLTTGMRGEVRRRALREVSMPENGPNRMQGMVSFEKVVRDPQPARIPPPDLTTKSVAQSAIPLPKVNLPGPTPSFLHSSRFAAHACKKRGYERVPRLR